MGCVARILKQYPEKNTKTQKKHLQNNSSDSQYRLNNTNEILSQKQNICAISNLTKLQYVSSGFRCRVITGSQMRLY